jgi:hypothetical protein
MSVEAEAAPAAGEAIPAHVAGGEGPLTALQAARSLTDWRNKQNAQVETQEASAEAAPPAQESEPAPAGEDAAPVEGQPSGETQEAEPALPPIEPPGSWTKEDKEEFATYPREAQEKIARREQERDTALRRSQNEAAEARKAVEADRAKADQVRQQYEQALPSLLQMLHEQQQGEFSDIKTMADVEKLAREDWPRYALWDAQQKKIAAVSAEVKATQERQATEFETKWSEYAKEQDRLLNERAPDLADKSKADKLTKAAQDYLSDIGFKPEELAQAWHGKASLSLRDHRLQLLILDGVRHREAQAAKAKVVAKPLPPVQRPGVAANRGADAEASIKSLENQLNKASGTKALRIAADLQAARRAAAR